MFGRKPNSVAPETGKREAQKLEALGQFAGGIAHDFNNILSVIESYASRALKQLEAGTLTPNELEKIISATQRGAGLTRQLLAFGRQKIALDEKIDLGRAIEEQRVLLHPLLGATVALSIHTPEEPVWINAASDQVTQIILNLALNARDAMSCVGALNIFMLPCTPADLPPCLKKSAATQGYIRISVIDTGSGITPDILPRIYDPFFTTKRQGSGTGLGLSVVYGIVEQLKGHITVESQAGKGTVFDVFIPITTPSEKVRDVRGADDLSLEGKTILLAEDETELRDLLALMLSDMKMKVITAGNGNEALMMQDAFEGEIDFLLTDVVMPEMDGVHLGALFETLRPRSSVVYMSGYPFIEGQRNNNVPDDANFLAKPLQEEKIRSILQRALERKQRRLEKESVVDDA